MTPKVIFLNILDHYNYIKANEKGLSFVLEHN